jgi:hypothetical protein
MKQLFMSLVIIAMTHLVISSVLAGFQEGFTALAKEDYIEAVHEFKPLAEKGQVKAQFNLALCYHKGLGVAEDPHSAAMWYRLAAAQEDPRAQYNLGLMYMKGWGVGEDYHQAGEWFLRAARQGYARAQYNLSIMYNEGLGRPLNYSKSIQWYTKAKKNGFLKGKNQLDHLGFTRSLADFYRDGESNDL